MKLLSPTSQKRVNELVGLLLLSLGLVLLLSLASYHVLDPSLNTAAATHPHNLIGYPGAWFADLLLQSFGIGSFVFPILLFGLAWKWVRSEEVEAGAIKLCGTLLLLLSLTAAVSFMPRLKLFGGAISIGGLLGMMLAHYLMHALNPTGAILLTITTLVVSVYLVSTFTVSILAVWFARPLRILRMFGDAFRLWRDERLRRSQEKAKLKAEQRAAKRKAEAATATQTTTRRRAPRTETVGGAAPLEAAATPVEAEEAPAGHSDIPICALEETAAPQQQESPPWEIPAPVAAPHPAGPLSYRLPPTDLLHEGQGRSPYDEQELKDIAVRDQSEVRRVQRAGLGGADQPGAGGDDLRIQAGGRHQVQPHHDADRRSVPGAAGRIDPDRAHSGQADGGHRGAEHQARSDRSAADAGVGRVRASAIAV